MTITDDLQAIGIQVKLVDGGYVITSALTEQQQIQYDDLLMEYFIPDKWQEELSHRAIRKQLKDEYQATLATLQQITDTASPTNAQVVAAVKFLAKTFILLLKLISRSYS
jgi:hypothetical protein